MKEASADENIISVGNFVSRLFAKCTNPAENKPSLSLHELLRYGHFRGWLEDQDERNPAAPLNRQTAARIVHLFLLIEYGVQDLPDITPATTLKDLYTCRVCANHIAQVYCRGIMGTNEDSFFNHLGLMTERETNAVIANCEAVKQSI